MPELLRFRNAISSRRQVQIVCYHPCLAMHLVRSSLPKCRLHLAEVVCRMTAMGLCRCRVENERPYRSHECDPCRRQRRIMAWGRSLLVVKRHRCVPNAWSRCLHLSCCFVFDLFLFLSCHSIVLHGLRSGLKIWEHLSSPKRRLACVEKMRRLRNCRCYVLMVHLCFCCTQMALMIDVLPEALSTSD